MHQSWGAVSVFHCRSCRSSSPNFRSADFLMPSAPTDLGMACLIYRRGFCTAHQSTFCETATPQVGNPVSLAPRQHSRYFKSLAPTMMAAKRKPTKRNMLKTLISALVAAMLVTAADAQTAQRPNIVVVLADDMGYSDIGCFGGEVKTPNLDALAAEGLRFTQFYNCGRCCPTRASLLTGLYPHQAGVGHMVQDRGKPGYIGRLNESSVTIAEVLQGAGYFAAVAGKWHVTPFDYNTHQASHRDSWPLQRGFDRFTGSLAGGRPAVVRGLRWAPHVPAIDRCRQGQR